MNPALRNFFTYGIPLLSGSFMLFWPACMQLSFFFTSLFSMGQAWLLRQPWMRNWLGIQPLPEPLTSSGATSSYKGTMNLYQPPSNAPPPEEKKGVIGGAISDIKSSFSQVADKARSVADSQTKTTTRRTAAELKYAKAYEERRRKEMENETAVREFEKEQRRKKANQGKNRHRR